LVPVPSILTLGRAMTALIRSATFKGFLTFLITTSVSPWVLTTMSPVPKILSVIDRVTSKSEKPAGATTNDFEVSIPVLISSPSFLRA